MNDYFIPDIYMGSACMSFRLVETDFFIFSGSIDISKSRKINGIYIQYYFFNIYIF